MQKNQKIIIRICLILISLVMTSCATIERDEESCELPDPVILKNKGDVLFQYWELSKKFVNRSEQSFKQDERLTPYKETLNRLYDTDPIALLESAATYEQLLDQKNNRIILAHKDKIREANCLESKLLAIQNTRKDLLKEPSEFIAFLLSKKDQYKLFYFTSNIAGVRSLGFIHSEIEKSIKNGWKLIYNLHNHNFFIGKKKYRGTIAPSSADSWVFKTELKDFGLKKALITNGFHTVKITPDMINQLSTGDMKMSE